jgi:hypothetical protein
MVNRKYRVYGLYSIVLGFLTSFALIFLSEGKTFVREGSLDRTILFFWPNVQTTVNLQLGCPPNAPLEHWGPCWDDAARDATSAWNNAGSQFRFSTQSTDSVGPCVRDGVNTVAFRSTLCNGMRFGDALAVTYIIANSATGAFLDTDVIFDAERMWSTYPGPLQRNALGRVTVYDFHRVVIHEFGHVLGLDHPDDFEQSVVAIMNSRVSDLDTLQSDDIVGGSSIYPATAASVGLLENPQQNGFVSGIGLISGWVCTASRVDIEFDGAFGLQAAYGTSRADTADDCGDDGNNGFGLLFNWNLLGDGIHVVRVLADGVEFASAAFTVTTLGQEFLPGATGRSTFQFNGRNVTVEWREELQNFVIVGVE